MIRQRVSRAWLSVATAAVAALAMFGQGNSALAQFNDLAAGWTSDILMENSSTLTISGTGNNIAGNIAFGTAGNLTLSGSPTGTISGHAPTLNYVSGTAPTGGLEYVNTNFAPVSYQGTSGNTVPGSFGSLTVNAEVAHAGEQIAQNPGPAQGTSTAYATNAFGNVATQISTALTDVNGIASTYGSFTGATTTLNPGGTLNVNTGNLDGSVEVFNATFGAGFNTGGASYAGSITLNGTGAQQVVLNVTGSPTFDGNVLLTGGLQPWNVIFNFTTASNTFTMDNFGHGSSGIYLDAANTSGTYNGAFKVTSGDVFGMLIGGGSGSTFAGSTIIASPEPSSFVIGAIGIIALVGWRALQLRKGKLA